MPVNFSNISYNAFELTYDISCFCYALIKLPVWFINSGINEGEIISETEFVSDMLGGKIMRKTRVIEGKHASFEYYKSDKQTKLFYTHLMLL